MNVVNAATFEHYRALRPPRPELPLRPFATKPALSPAQLAHRRRMLAHLGGQETRSVERQRG